MDSFIATLSAWNPLEIRNVAELRDRSVRMEVKNI